METPNANDSENAPLEPSEAGSMQRMDMPREEPQSATRWAWWVARLANELTMYRREWLEPQIGDSVVETTHILGLARHALGLEVAAGELVEIADGTYGKKYLIKNPAGKLMWWENARIVVIERHIDKIRHDAESAAPQTQKGNK